MSYSSTTATLESMTAYTFQWWLGFHILTVASSM